jgi:methylmalonyl-CoA/ethylmalonyl-CoA epimerase
MIAVEGFKFHHFGLAVKRDKAACRFLESLGYTLGEKIYDPEQDVNLRLCVADKQPAVELVTPGNGEGPLTPILKRQSEAIYHICYEVSEAGTSIDALNAAGHRVIQVVEPKPAILFEGRLVSFYQVLGFGLIELLEQ